MEARTQQEKSRPVCGDGCAARMRGRVGLSHPGCAKHVHDAPPGVLERRARLVEPLEDLNAAVPGLHQLLRGGEYRTLGVPALVREHLRLEGSNGGPGILQPDSLYRRGRVIQRREMLVCIRVRRTGDALQRLERHLGCGDQGRGYPPVRGGGRES